MSRARRGKVASHWLPGTLFSIAALAGCTMEPHYQRPQADLASDWPEATTSAMSEASDIGWREFFADARLQKLVELALLHNPDARVARLNIAAARAQYQIQ